METATRCGGRPRRRRERRPDLEKQRQLEGDRRRGADERQKQREGPLARDRQPLDDPFPGFAHGGMYV